MADSQAVRGLLREPSLAFETALDVSTLGSTFTHAGHCHATSCTHHAKLQVIKTWRVAMQHFLTMSGFPAICAWRLHGLDLRRQGNPCLGWAQFRDSFFKLGREPREFLVRGGAVFSRMENFHV